MSISKTDLLVKAPKTEANQVLGSSLTVSTRRVESITSKATVSEKVPVLAKSQSEEEAKTQSHKEKFLKNTLSNSFEHFQERSEQNGLVLVRVFQKGPWKTLAHEMSKVPLILMDNRLHTSLYTMTCSFTGLNQKNKPKPAI